MSLIFEFLLLSNALDLFFRLHFFLGGVTTPGLDTPTWSVCILCVWVNLVRVSVYYGTIGKNQIIENFTMDGLDEHNSVITSINSTTLAPH